MKKEIDDLIRSMEHLGAAARELCGAFGISLPPGAATVVGLALILAVIAAACFVVVGLARVIHRRMRS